MVFSFEVPTKVFFGWGEIKKIGKLVKGYGKKSFVVIDPFLKSSIGEEIKKYLEIEGIEAVFFDKIVSNPTYELIDEGALIAKKENCRVIIGIGGGSTIDTAKGISVVLGNGGSSWNYVFRTDHEVKEPKNVFPVIAVPTTAGTGSEVTLYSVITNPHIKEKSTIIHSSIYPKVALVDPSLTLTVPSYLTATTGFDAFAHAMEAYISKKSNPFSDMIALEAIRRIFRYLPTAVVNGDNITARVNVAYGATLAGIAISQAGTALPHAVGQAIGGRYNAPHGETLAICFLEIMKNSYLGAPEKFATFLDVVDEKYPGFSVRQKAEKSVEVIERFIEDIGLKNIKLTKYGVSKQDLPKIVESILKGYKQDVDVHPRRFTKDDLMTLLTQLI
ncbi:MAG: iron-containing alcohol dehydrogenase [Thermosipho sp. (in: Bacteria)]|nr:iron-containing alcohol dehydrogenase [Thermosipho sp. (in: thermotogales)]